MMGPCCFGIPYHVHSYILYGFILSSVLDLFNQSHLAKMKGHFHKQRLLLLVSFI